MQAADEVRETQRVKVWDPWIRLVHWLLVLLVPFSWWTGKQGNWDLHFLSGYAILSLLVFRLAWGLVGSETARFGRFLRSPLEGLRHLRHLGRRAPDTQVGHNAAGGWMVLVMLGLLLAQASTGLFADDLILTRGPLARSVDPVVSDAATSVHLRVIWAIIGTGALHLLAIAAYAALPRHDLVRPMVTGTKRLPAGAAAPRMGNPALALLLLAAAAGAVWWVVSLGG